MGTAALTFTLSFIGLQRPASTAQVVPVTFRTGDTFALQSDPVFSVGVPQVTDLTSSSARITFTTAEPASVSLWYWDRYTTRKLTDRYDTDHSFRLGPLKAGTTYIYRIVASRRDGYAVAVPTQPFVTPRSFDIGTITVWLLGHDTASLSWTTEVPTAGAVFCGIPQTLRLCDRFDALTTSHRSWLHGIAGTHLTYVIHALDRFGNTDTSQPFSFSSNPKLAVQLLRFE